MPPYNVRYTRSLRNSYYMLYEHENKYVYVSWTGCVELLVLMQAEW